MSETSAVKSAISSLVSSTRGQLHREEYFTIMLFARMWPDYGGRILSTTGVHVNAMLPFIDGSEVNAIRKKYLPKTKEFYPDLLVTASHGHNSLDSTFTIDEVIEQTTITHIYEFKTLTSFPTLGRAKAREDTVKLKIVGEYIYQKTGKTPHMEQFLIATLRQEAKGKRIANLLRWFDDDQFKDETRGVEINIVDVDGIMHQAGTRRVD